MSEIPSELRYTRSHEWVRIEDDGTVTIGITDHAQEALGDIVFVEPPEVGTHFDAEEGCCVVESVKAASDIYMPISGEVIDTNGTLVDEPDSINSSPYEDGWIFRVRPDDIDDADELLDSGSYEDELEEEDDEDDDD